MQVHKIRGDVSEMLNRGATMIRAFDYQDAFLQEVIYYN